MSDNFVSIPLENDPIPEVIVEEPVTVQEPLDGIQPEDSRPKGDDYIPERIQYLKRLAELTSVPYTPVSDMVRLLIKDLDGYTRGEISIEEIETNCPEYEIQIDNEHIANREYIIPYNTLRTHLLRLHKEEFGEK